MSLQIWLPLNGSLKNQGLCDIEPEMVGTLNVNSGKVTNQSYHWDTDGQAICLPGYMDTLKTYPKYSMCAWVYFAGSSTNHSSVICSSGDWNQTANQLCFALYTNDKGQKYILTPNQQAWQGGVAIDAPALNTWHHIGLTYDGAKTTVYMNGQKVGTYNGGGITLTPNTTNLYIGCATYYTGFTLKGRINDFRIYDHNLTAKEMTEVAKGLMLHYKLQGQESFTNQNLLINAGKYTKHTPLVHTSAKTDGYATTDMYCQVTPGETYVLSCETDGTWSGHNTGAGVVSTNCTIWAYLTKTYNPENTGYDKAECFGSSNGSGTFVYTVPAGYNGLRIRTNTYSDGTNPTTVNFWNFKLEKGDIKTIWMPPKDDEQYGRYIDLFEYDLSGYGNHAECVGNCESVKTGSPRYQYNLHLNGDDSYIISNETINIPKLMTMSCWVKQDGTAGHLIDWRKNEIVNGETIQNIGIQPFYLNANGKIQYWSSVTGGGAYFENYVMPTNTWQHICFVSNGTQTNLYVNGEAKGSVSTVNTETDAKLYIGSRYGEPYNDPVFDMVDLRIYATVFNEEDIKKLYNTPIELDKNNILYGYSFTDSLEKIQFKKTGVLGANEGIGNLIIGANIDLNNYNTKILEDGSRWLRIYYLNTAGAGGAFASTAEALDCEIEDKFSKLKDIDVFKSSDGVYEFMLTYPSLSPTLYNRWQQTNSPNVAYGQGTGYQQIQMAWNTSYGNGPLTKVSSGSSIYAVNTNGNWWGPIGQFALHQSGIPAADSSIQTETELWVRVDTLSYNSQMKFFENYILTNDYIEF